jgi:hypothetical protein
MRIPEILADKASIAESAIVSGLARLHSYKKMSQSRAVVVRRENQIFRVGLQNGSREQGTVQNLCQS